jgi:bifunctional non-homologous end joining protein LigD
LGLATYQRKRDFTRTAEPKGRAGRGKGPGKSARRGADGKRREPVFVVQKHDASRLHYDLRLEHDGVLKSWAVPKGPSLDPAERVLAVQVEDHPLEYGGFEGTIPKGEYGGGTVMLWDRGTWEPEGDAGAGLKAGKLKFRLRGERLSGGWTLVRMRGRAGDDGKNWLLIKERDEHARPASDSDIRAEADASIDSGRTMAEIAAGNGSVHRRAPGGGKAAAKGGVKTKRAPGAAAPEPAAKRGRGVGAGKGGGGRARGAIDPASLTGSRRGEMPAAVSPQLAKLVQVAPRGEEWLHEVKFDGYRVLCMISEGRARLLTRTGKDWTAKFEAVAGAAARLNVERAVLDGEVTALRPDGMPDFQLLQNVLNNKASVNLAYFVFDLLYCNGFDLTAAPLRERKALLERLMPPGGVGPLRYSEHMTGEGGKVMENACRLGLEGVVSKRADSPYTSGRTGTWVKSKCTNRQEFVIGGYTPPAGSRSEFGALLVGVHEPGGRLAYAGKVGTGYSERTLKSLRAKLKPLETETSPFEKPPVGAAVREVRWVRPELVAEVKFSEWTDDGRLRHPAFLGLREDKPAVEVVRERPAPKTGRSSEEEPPVAKTRARAGGRTTTGRSPRPKPGGADTEVAGVRISNPGRVVYSDAKVTKVEVARYYEEVARWALPHTEGRPLSLVRCPKGSTGKCFYQKQLTAEPPEGLRGVDVGEKRPYAAVEDARGLVSLIQMGVLEVHPWGSRIEDLDHPDRLIFDLDPGPGVKWELVAEGAVEVRRILRGAGLESFVKTTGGKGLHVVAPLDGSADWDRTKAFARAVADTMAAMRPERYLAVASKAARGGKIFVDYLRNGRGATAVAPYSPRARKGATVSTPITWRELAAGVDPSAFTIRTVPARMHRQKKDPWDGYTELRQAVPEGLAAKRRRR